MLATLIHPRVFQVAAPFEGNDVQASLPPPTGTVNTVAAHWREAQRH